MCAREEEVLYCDRAGGWKGVHIYHRSEKFTIYQFHQAKPKWVGTA